MLQDLGIEDFTGLEGGASAFSSPAMPSVFDVATGAAGNLGTVSPQDLLLQDPPFMSAPNSTALTALTSPSLYDGSPAFSDTYDVSPNFEGNDLDPASDVSWFSLFPESGVPIKPLPQNSSAAQLAAAAHQQQSLGGGEQTSPATGSEDLDSSCASPSTSRRNKSGSGNSPPSASTPSHGRHSSVSGVGSRRRDKPLPPIVVDDPNDTVAMKRARNTLAARKSRERKAQRFDELEAKIESLEAKSAALEADRNHWRKLAETLSSAGANASGS